MTKSLSFPDAARSRLESDDEAQRLLTLVSRIGNDAFYHRSHPQTVLALTHELDRATLQLRTRLHSIIEAARKDEMETRRA